MADSSKAASAGRAGSLKGTSLSVVDVVTGRRERVRRRDDGVGPLEGATRVR